jgi:hypothetical protein
MELKHRYEETQDNIKKIEREVDKLMAEKRIQEIEREVLEKKLHSEAYEKDQQIHSLKEALLAKDIALKNLEAQNELTLARMGNESAVKDSQIDYFRKQGSNLEHEIT